MPSQRHSGKRGVPWSRCDRCKFDYPLDRLMMQDGLLLCLEKCIDNTLIWLRDRAISRTLRFPREEPLNVTARVRKFPNLIRK